MPDFVDDGAGAAHEVVYEARVVALVVRTQGQAVAHPVQLDAVDVPASRDLLQMRKRVLAHLAVGVVERAVKPALAARHAPQVAALARETGVAEEIRDLRSEVRVVHAH